MPRARRVFAAPLLGVLAVLAAACDASSARVGRQLFDGEAALAGRIQGHSVALPASASRCSNCHEFGAPAPVPPRPASGIAAALAGSKISLSAPSLLDLRPRRGGPPSRFDEASFCRLLRTGLDPASVLIPQSMPRYDIDAPQCKALWAYLSRGAG